MEGTTAVRQAVENEQLVMACAYQGNVPDAVTAALPSHYPHRRYVAMLMDGELVDVREGLPEDVIPAMIAAPASPWTESRTPLR